MKKVKLTVKRLGRMSSSIEKVIEVESSQSDADAKKNCGIKVL